MRIRHLLVDAHGCTGSLDDAEQLLGLLRDAAATVGAHEQGVCEVRFVPHGATVVLVLAESHMLISTWPEHRLALVEMLLCNPSMDPHVAWERVKGALCPARVELREVVRGIEP